MKYLLYTLFLILSSSIYSQDYIKSVVISEESNLPLQNANVYLKSAHIGSVTNEKGVFKIDKNQIQTKDSLVISFVGFKDVVLPVQPNTILKDTIIIQPHAVLLKELIITNRKISDILSLCIQNFEKNTVSSDLKGELIQKSLLDNHLIKLFASKVFLKFKKKRVKLYVDAKNSISKISCSDLYRNEKVMYISQLTSFLNTKEKLQWITENLKHFESSVYESNYSNKEVYVIHLKKEVEKGKSSNIKITVDNKSYAIIEMEIFGDRGIGRDKLKNIEENDVVLASRIPKYSSAKIGFRKYHNEKWILSKVEASLTIDYIENPKSDDKTLKTNDNTLSIIINSICDKNCKKGFEHIDTKKDIFKQINTQKKVSNKISYYYEFDEKETHFINKK